MLHAGRKISGFCQNTVEAITLLGGMLCSIPDDDACYYISITSLFQYGNNLSDAPFFPNSNI